MPEFLRPIRVPDHDVEVGHLRIRDGLFYDVLLLSLVEYVTLLEVEGDYCFTQLTTPVTYSVIVATYCSSSLSKALTTEIRSTVVGRLRYSKPCGLSS